MPSDFNKREAERVVKRLKKSQLVDYLAQLMDRHETEQAKTREWAATTLAENERLRREERRLEPVRATINHVLARRGRLISDKQLRLLLQAEPQSDEHHRTNAADILDQILANCEEFTEEFGGASGAPSYDELQDALDCALSDRAELLRRLGLTEFQWSLAGGYSPSDVEP